MSSVCCRHARDRFFGKRKKKHPSSVRHGGASRSVAPGHQQTFEGFIRCLTTARRRRESIRVELQPLTLRFSEREGDARVSHVTLGSLPHVKYIHVHRGNIEHTCHRYRQRSSSCDTAWRHESSRLLGKQRRVVDEFMGNAGGRERGRGEGEGGERCGEARRVEEKGEDTTRMLFPTRVSW